MQSMTNLINYKFNLMKKNLILAIAFFMAISSQAQSIFGEWKTIDDETGKEKSIVQIYEEDGKAYAQIKELLDPESKGKVCDNCKGDKKNKPIKGMVIIDGLKEDGDEWNGAKILDPKTGKVYKCYITLENENKLKVRGYIGFALIGRTQYWHRVE